MLGPLRWLKQTRPVRLIIQAGQEWSEDKTLELGAALAYYAVFAIAPVILIAIAAASLVFGRQAAEGNITDQLESTVGPTVAGAISASLQYSYRSGSGVLATFVGVGVLFVSAMGLFGQLQSSLNTIWGVRPKPGRGLKGIVTDRLGSFLAVLGACLLILATMAANMVLSALNQMVVPEQLPAGMYAWRLLTAGVSFVLLTIAMAMVFKLLPDVIIAWRHVWVGAIVSTLLLILGNYLISLYLQWSGVSSTYGAAGSLVVILLWAYYSAQVLLFGAEFTLVYARNSGEPIRPAGNAEAVSANDRLREGRSPKQTGGQTA